MIRKRFLLPLLFVLALPLLTEAQIEDDSRGWQFGLNFGFYKPAGYSANYYNGSSGNMNNVKWVMSNFYWYQEIYTKLIAYDTVFVSGLPSNMHYKIAMMPGLYGQYTFNDIYSLLIQFNFMKLKAQDAITFEVDPKPYSTLPDLRMYVIRGEEDRVYIDLGVKRNFPLSRKTSVFAMAGFNLNNTKVKKSSFFVEDKEYSIINIYGSGTYIPGGNTQSYQVYQGGIGFGLFLSGGATFQFGEVVFEPGINAHWLNVDLDGYKKFKPGGGVYIRFLFNNAFGAE